MPAYSGKFQYAGEAGETISQGPCQLKFEKETWTVTPSGGAPIAGDLGDVDALARGEWDLQLKLFTGRTLALRQFGPAFGRMADELTAAWRDRTIECLLLEDLEEVGRFNGTAALSSAGGTPAEIRIFKSNIAILPIAGMPFQWRLAEVDSMLFDETAYAITLTGPGQRLVLSKLGRKTDECASVLQGTLDALRQQSADILHKLLPFLDPDRLQRLLTLMPEGRSVKLAALSGIHPKLVDALLARAVTLSLKPYFDVLRSRSAPDSLMLGYKFVREDEAESEEPPPDEVTEQQPEGEHLPIFFWFFFPLAGKNAVAWEATTGSGRATYLFSAAAPVEAEIASLTRGLSLVNFRREPIYLPDDSLDQQERFHRYAIGARKLPDLRKLRSAFRGRAIHSSLDKWTSQLDSAAG